MKITPLDIRKQMFRKTMRGFDEHEVNAFLELIAAQVEDLLQDNRTLQDRLRSMEVQVENYEKIEEALRNALVTAEKVARETKMNADQEVELTMKEAQHRAQRAVESARSVLDGVQNDLVGMAKQRRDYLTRFRLLVETQLKMLDLKKIEFEDEENLRRLEEIQSQLFGSEAQEDHSPRPPSSDRISGPEYGEESRGAPEEDPTPADVIAADTTPPQMDHPS